jgi:hypothetical protein
VERTPPPPTPPVTHIRLVLNWTEKLKAELPTGVRYTAGGCFTVEGLR